MLGPLFTCQVVAHFPKEDFSVFILKTLVFCEQRGSFAWTVLGGVMKTFLDGVIQGERRSAPPASESLAEAEEWGDGLVAELGLVLRALPVGPHDHVDHGEAGDPQGKEHQA